MKESEIKTIWSVPKYLPYVQPELTDEILLAAEKQLGYKLPKEYIELLKIQNGGYIRFTLSGDSGQLFGIGPCFPSITSTDLTDYTDTVSYELNGLIPFDGDGNWYICFDYRKGSTFPEITFIDLECDEEEVIADNFKEYVGLLEIDVDNIYVIETKSTIEDVLKEISKVVNIEFEEPDFYNYGYADYRGKFKDGCMWVNPNRVPASFIREEDENYEQLKFLAGDTSLRYPELSNSCLLISFSDDKIRKEFIKTFINSSIKLQQLEEFLDL